MQRQVTFICIKAHFGSNLSEERFTSSEYPSLFGRLKLTRKPEELSRRQRKRHMKFLSRKEEFSGGRCSGLQVSKEELLSASISVRDQNPLSMEIFDIESVCSSSTVCV